MPENYIWFMCKQKQQQQQCENVSQKMHEHTQRDGERARANDKDPE